MLELKRDFRLNWFSSFGLRLISRKLKGIEEVDFISLWLNIYWKTSMLLLSNLYASTLRSPYIYFRSYFSMKVLKCAKTFRLESSVLDTRIKIVTLSLHNYGHLNFWMDRRTHCYKIYYGTSFEFSIVSILLSGNS